MEEYDEFRLLSNTCRVVDRRMMAAPDPKQTSAIQISCVAKYALFDQLVGTQKERLGDGEPDRLGSLEVNHQLELGRELNRQFAHLGAAQQAVDVGGGAAVQVNDIHPIADQAAPPRLRPP
jgi:hypothetical protein